MQRDDEGQVKGFFGRLGSHEVVPSEPGRQEDRMAETRDREQFGDALQHPDHDGLKVGDQRPELSWGPLSIHAPISDRTASPTMATPCLTWCLVECASCPGRNEGRSAAGFVQ